MKKFLASIILIFSALAGFFAWAGPAWGQRADVTYHPPVAALDVGTLVNNAVSVILGTIGLVALVAFIWGGVTWMTSGGDASKITKARKTMIWAVAGLVIIFASYSILLLLFNAFGYSAPSR